MFNHLKHPLVLAVAVLCVASVGCQQQGNPVTFSVSVPAPNTVGFQANLTQHYGIGLSGSFDLPKSVGSISLVAESPQQGFGLGFNLNTRAFLKETWTDFREVNALPTGASFPSWMGVPVVDVMIPELNHYGVDYHVYLGDHGQYYLGVAGVIHAVDEHFPSVNIGYTFYDPKGNVIVGFQFFGPKIGPDGKAEVKGGIFIGTNLTPLLPKPAPPAGVVSSGLSVSSVQALELANRANQGKPIVINGVSATAYVETSGADARRYRSKSSIKKLIDRYAEASRKTY